MPILTRPAIEAALTRVIDSDTGLDVVSAGMISGIVVREGDKGAKVGFVITIDPKDKERKGWLRQACEEQVKTLPGVESVTAVLTAENVARDTWNVEREESPATSHEPRATSPRPSAHWNTTPIDGVNKIVAVASGKGGVGKSTTAVNLALALAKQGVRAGLLDADIYGPSIPRMMGLPLTKPEIVDNKMIPPQSQGIACMSMGFITGEEAAILRGPMISKTLHQLLRFTRWATIEQPVDVLLVDMPPGTGDIHLSMVQQVPLSGAIIVTTPQEVAVMDARKALRMFEKTGVAITGVVENMSGSIFGSGGGKRLAQETNVPFLGEIPMDAAIVAASDAGTPYGGDVLEHYAAIAKRLL